MQRKPLDGRRRRLPSLWFHGSALLACLVIATGAQGEEGCSGARLQSLGSPARETWQSALGADSTELRIQLSAAPGKWITAHAPRWEAAGLLAQHRSWPPDTLRVAWDEITRVETRVEGSPTKGMAIGGAIGAGIAIGIGVAGSIADDDWAWLAVPIVGLFTIPTGIILGGSLGQNPHWEPVYCAEHD